MINPTTFGVRRRIIDAGKARMGNRPGTHRAGLQRDPKVAPIQPIIAQNPRCRPDCLHFCVRCRVLGGPHPVCRRRNFHPVFGDDSADRHFTSIGRCLRKR